MSNSFYEYIQNPGNPVVVIAEMAWAHDGSLEKAKKIVEGAHRAGADAFNMHVTVIPDYMVSNYAAGQGRVSNTDIEISSVYKYLEDINLSLTDYKLLADHVKSLGLKASVMCNDCASLEFVMDNIHPDLLMVHPSSITDSSFLRQVAENSSPIMLYCGGLRLGEIERAIQVCQEAGNNQIILQHGFQNYPTLVEHNNVLYLKTLRDMFGYPVSFTDHTDAEDPMAFIVPMLSLPLGVRIIEKHITFNRAEKGEDYESALNPDEFAQLVDQLHQAEKALGTASWKMLSPKQYEYRNVVFKRAVAKDAIEEGEILTSEKIAYKRSDAGFLPQESELLLNKVKSRKAIPKDAPITWENVS